MRCYTSARNFWKKCYLRSIGLAKKFIQVFPYHLTNWPTQYITDNSMTNGQSSKLQKCQIYKNIKTLGLKFKVQNAPERDGWFWSTNRNLALLSGPGQWRAVSRCPVSSQHRCSVSLCGAGALRLRSHQNVLRLVENTFFQAAFPETGLLWFWWSGKNQARWFKWPRGV